VWENDATNSSLQMLEIVGVCERDSASML